MALDLLLVMLLCATTLAWMSCGLLAATLAEQRRGPVVFAALVGLALGPFDLYLLRAGIKDRSRAGRRSVG